MNLSAICFEKPSLVPDLKKPRSIANQSLPYNHIASPRRFEELLYNIFDLKIGKGIIDTFDEVNLMTGVRDQGRDCTLMRSGRCYGLIQCKQYEKNYGKEEFGLEIVRFVLYSLVDERLIADRNDFTYYIAVSRGFTSECGKFIDDFSNLISDDPKLRGWVDKNLELPSLEQLKLTLDYLDFKKLISGLKIKKIIPQDLDSDLGCAPCNSLLPLFFEVMTVIDTEGFREIMEEYKNPNLSEADLLAQLKIGSARLSSERNTFQNIGDVHIERNETGQLFDWISQAAEKKGNQVQNVCLLSGQAGYGKTVVLKDLYTLCIENGYAVLGLKADKLYSNTVTALKESLGLSLPVYHFIEECKQHFDRVVVLVDQIDALSQSMSSDRSYLALYREFIDYFANDESVRFVVSVRTADLHYDPSLKVYRNIKNIKLELLDQEQVLGLLEKIGIDRSKISIKLLELLRVPNHLDVFSQLVSERDVPEAGSVLDLYLELWKLKVQEIKDETPAKPAKVKELLYLIAGKMYETQRITVPVLPYEDDFAKELHYLDSERLIKIEERQLQFFHQSFYDFVFAKQFVEKGKNLLVYIREGEQSLNIHSAVKMIISYLKDYDKQVYFVTINDIFSDPEVLFQIKHILMVTVLSHEAPNEQECGFVLNALEKSFHWHSVFFDHGIAKPWLLLAIKKSLLGILEGDGYQPGTEDRLEVRSFHLAKARTAASDFIKRFVLQNDDDAWDVLERLDNGMLTRWILCLVTDWSSQRPYQVFEGMTDFEEVDSHRYYDVLGNIAKVNPTYVLALLETILPEHFKKGYSNNDYLENEVLKTLSKNVPHLLYPILFKAMKTEFDRDKEENDGEEFMIRDFAYSYTDLRDSDELFGSEYLYQLLAVCVRRSAKDHQREFISFFDQHKNSRYRAIHRLLLFAFDGLEAAYPKHIFELFCFFETHGLLGFQDDIENEMRTLIEKTFIHFDKEQQAYIIRVIKNYVNPRELSIFWDNKGKAHFNSKWGLSKYYLIKRLPKQIIEEFLKGDFRELEDKFRGSRYTDAPRRRRVLAGAVSSPISLENCAKMNAKSWLGAFRQYDSEQERRGADFLKGSLRELANAFKSTVKSYPTSEKLTIIYAVIDAKDIPLKYAVNGLWGWLEGGGDVSSAIPLAKKMLGRVSGEDRRIFIGVIARLIGFDKEEPEFVNFLVEMALDFAKGNEKPYETPEDKTTSIQGLIQKAINTDYGEAINALVRVKDPEFSDIVFETMEFVFREGPRESRAGALFEFAYLLNLNNDRAFALFLDALEKEEDIYVIASSIWSFQYMRNFGFEKLAPIFERLIVSGLLGDEDANMLFVSLYASYVHGQQEAEALLDKMLDAHKGIRSMALRQLLKHYYVVEGSKEKNDRLLKRLFDSATEEEFAELNLSFSNAEHLKLEDVYWFLDPFVQSRFFKLSDYFINFLTLQIAYSPFKAVKLFELAINNKNAKKDDLYTRIDEKAITFVINAFNGLNSRTDEARQLRHKLLVLFGTLLQDYRHYKSSERILEELS